MGHTVFSRAGFDIQPTFIEFKNVFILPEQFCYFNKIKLTVYVFF